MDQIGAILLVLSGKGGVGKSTVTTQLALTLAESGLRIGVLDIDLTGPSLPEMFGVQDQQVLQSSKGWIPVYTDETQRLGIMSLGFLLKNKDDAVVWRGPKKTAMISQFVNDVAWGPLDYLLIDTPPGTSDEHISIAESLREFNRQAIIVTTPQAVSLNDVKREINFCRKKTCLDLFVRIVLYNYLKQECSDIFSSGGGEKLAESMSIPFHGRIPLDPQLTTLIEGSNFSQVFKQSPLFPIFQAIADKVKSSHPQAV